MRVYLDAAPVIYYVERVPDFVTTAGKWMTTPGNILVASDLTRLECRIVPIRAHDDILLAGFDRFFSDVASHVVPLSGVIIDRATIIRAEHGFRTPDALHLAAAVESGCEIFLTNDLRLSRFRDIHIEVIARA